MKDREANITIVNRNLWSHSLFVFFEENVTIARTSWKDTLEKWDCPFYRITKCTWGKESLLRHLCLTKSHGCKALSKTCSEPAPSIYNFEKFAEFCAFSILRCYIISLTLKSMLNITYLLPFFLLLQFYYRLAGTSLQMF